MYWFIHAGIKVTESLTKTPWHGDAIRNAFPLWAVGSPHKCTALMFIGSRNKVLNKYSSCVWFKTPCLSCDVNVMCFITLTPHSKLHLKRGWMQVDSSFEFNGKLFKNWDISNIICIPWLLYMWRLRILAHYNDVIMSAMASQMTSLTIVYSTVYSGTNQRKHQSFASLAFVRGIHRWAVNSPHKGPVTRKMFPTLMTSSYGSTVHANDKVIKQGYAELKVEDELKNARLFFTSYT